jgi:exodeoxyribonuclease VII small subunit
MTKKNTIGETLKKLESIAAWFEDQKEADIEEGLKKVREGAELIKELKTRLKEAENEFNEIKKELSD